MGRLWDDHFRDLGHPPKFYRVQDACFIGGSSIWWHIIVSFRKNQWKIMNFNVFSPKWHSTKKKSSRQGCWPQKCELGMPQKLEKLNRQFFCLLRPRGVLNRRSLFPSLHECCLRRLKNLKEHVLRVDKNNNPGMTKHDRLRNREKFLWLTGGWFPDFFIFHRFLLEVGVLVHPHSGLLWPASLPGAFFVFECHFCRSTCFLVIVQWFCIKIIIICHQIEEPPIKPASWTL